MPELEIRIIPGDIHLTPINPAFHHIKPFIHRILAQVSGQRDRRAPNATAHIKDRVILLQSSKLHQIAQLVPALRNKISGAREYSATGGHTLRAGTDQPVLRIHRQKHQPAHHAPRARGHCIVNPPQVLLRIGLHARVSRLNPQVHAPHFAPPSSGLPPTSARASPAAAPPRHRGHGSRGRVPRRVCCRLGSARSSPIARRWRASCRHVP